MGHPEQTQPLTLYFGDVVQIGTANQVTGEIAWSKTGVVGNVYQHAFTLAEIVGDYTPTLTTFGTVHSYARLVDAPRWTTLDVATAIVRGHFEVPQTVEEIDIVANTIKDLLESFMRRAQEGPWTYPYGYRA